MIVDAQPDGRKTTKTTIVRAHNDTALRMRRGRGQAGVRTACDQLARLGLVAVRNWPVRPLGRFVFGREK